MLGHALIYSFITAADEDNTRKRGIPPSGLLVKRLSGCGQENDGRSWSLRPWLGRITQAMPQQRFHRFEDGFGLHHHAFAAAEGPIVYGAVAVPSECAQVLHVYIDHPRLPRA